MLGIDALAIPRLFCYQMGQRLMVAILLLLNHSGLSTDEDAIKIRAPGLFQARALLKPKAGQNATGAIDNNINSRPWNWKVAGGSYGNVLKLDAKMNPFSKNGLSASAHALSDNHPRAKSSRRYHVFERHVNLQEARSSYAYPRNRNITDTDRQHGSVQSLLQPAAPETGETRSKRATQECDTIEKENIRIQTELSASKSAYRQVLGILIFAIVLILLLLLLHCLVIAKVTILRKKDSSKATQSSEERKSTEKATGSENKTMHAAVAKQDPPPYRSVVASEKSNSEDIQQDVIDTAKVDTLGIIGTDFEVSPARCSTVSKEKAVAPESTGLEKPVMTVAPLGESRLCPPAKSANASCINSPSQDTAPIISSEDERNTPLWRRTPPTEAKRIPVRMKFVQSTPDEENKSESQIIPGKRSRKGRIAALIDDFATKSEGSVAPVPRMKMFESPQQPALPLRLPRELTKEDLVREERKRKRRVLEVVVKASRPRSQEREAEVARRGTKSLGK